MVLASNSFFFLTVLIQELPANGTVTHSNLVYPRCSGGTELCLEGWRLEKHMEMCRGVLGKVGSDDCHLSVYSMS